MHLHDILPLLYCMAMLPCLYCKGLFCTVNTYFLGVYPMRVDLLAVVGSLIGGELAMVVWMRATGENGAYWLYWLFDFNKQSQIVYFIM